MMRLSQAKQQHLGHAGHGNTMEILASVHERNCWKREHASNYTGNCSYCQHLGKEEMLKKELKDMTEAQFSWDEPNILGY